MITQVKFSILLLIMGAGLFLAPGVPEAQEQVRFSWAVLTDTDKGLRNLDFTTVPKLANGTTIQFYLEQKPGTYLYLYLVDSGGGLDFLFPGEPDYYDTIPPSDRIYRIPADTDRFELTPPGGQEKLYLLASPVRLTSLERLTGKFLEQPGDASRRAAVIQELKRIRRQHSRLARTTETSVPIAGTVRSRGALFDSFEVTKVNAPGFYSRILRLDHD